MIVLPGARVEMEVQRLELGPQAANEVGNWGVRESGGRDIAKPQALLGSILGSKWEPARRQVVVPGTPLASQALGHPCGGPAGVTGNQSPDDPAGGEKGCSCGWYWTFGPLLYPPSGIDQAQVPAGFMVPQQEAR